MSWNRVRRFCRFKRVAAGTWQRITVLNTFLPRTIDNTYRGRRIALWLLGFVIVVKVAQMVSVVVDPGVIQGADGIPLDTFSPQAARTFVAAVMGMCVSRLFICIVCALVLWRYRSAIVPLFSLLAVHDLARELVLRPVRVGTPIGPWVNGVLLVLMLAGVALALPQRAGPARGQRHDEGAHAA